MVDVTEILAHWYAGRSKNQIAESLGLDRKTVRKYLAPAEAAAWFRAGRRSARRNGGTGRRGGSRSWPMPGCGSDLPEIEKHHGFITGSCRRGDGQDDPPAAHR